MALDRQSIEKKDFPIGRRGYDPEAVDTHLRLVADEVDTLKRSARQRSETVATTASEQVRAVIAAAEASSAEITRQAEDEAREIRDEATSEAKRTRDDANQRAHDYVGRVAEATTALLQRVDAMQGELNTLLDALRTGAHRVDADLKLLEGNLGELSTAVGRPRFEPEPGEAGVSTASGAGALASGRPSDGPVEDPGLAEHAAGGPAAEPDALRPDPDAPQPASANGAAASAASGGETDAAGGAGTAEAERIADDLVRPPAAETVVGSAAPVGPGVADGNGPATSVGDGEESARLVALDMALSGTPREETDRYLAENFQLADRAALLDEVYATVEG